VIARPLLVTPADHVVRHDASGSVGIGDVDVESDQQRHRSQSLHRRTQIAPNHRRQLVGLAVEGERHALDLLVVLEFDSEQTNQFDCDTRSSGNARSGVLVGDVDLLHVTVGDQIALSGAPITGDQHPARVGEGDDRRPVRSDAGLVGGAVGGVGRQVRGEAALRQQVRGVLPEVVGEGRATGPQRNRRSVACRPWVRTIHRHWPPF
jgi:hypothetical protein